MRLPTMRLPTLWSILRQRVAQVAYDARWFRLTEYTAIPNPLAAGRWPLATRQRRSAPATPGISRMIMRILGGAATASVLSK